MKVLKKVSRRNFVADSVPIFENLSCFPTIFMLYLGKEMKNTPSAAAERSRLPGKRGVYDEQKSSFISFHRHDGRSPQRV